MTKHELKREVEKRGGRFFSRENMRFSGDTMRNYGVRKATVTTRSNPEPIEVWELYRKKPTEAGLSQPAHFRMDNFERVFALEG